MDDRYTGPLCKPIIAARAHGAVVVEVAGELAAVVPVAPFARPDGATGVSVRCLRGMIASLVPGQRWLFVLLISACRDDGVAGAARH